MAAKKKNEADREFVDRWTSDGAGIVWYGRPEDKKQKKASTAAPKKSASAKGKGKKA